MPTSLHNLHDAKGHPRTLSAAERKSLASAEYLSAAEAALYMRTAPATIYRRIRDGSIPAVKLGRRFIRIRKADLDALREGGES